jgi:hypothetical protein
LDGIPSLISAIGMTSPQELFLASFSQATVLTLGSQNKKLQW